MEGRAGVKMLGGECLEQQEVEAGWMHQPTRPLRKEPEKCLCGGYSVDCFVRNSLRCCN
jgi:hypothetical protein